MPARPSPRIAGPSHGRPVTVHRPRKAESPRSPEHKIYICTSHFRRTGAIPSDPCLKTTVLSFCSGLGRLQTVEGHYAGVFLCDWITCGPGRWPLCWINYQPVAWETRRCRRERHFRAFVRCPVTTVVASAPTVAARTVCRSRFCIPIHFGSG